MSSASLLANGIEQGATGLTARLKVDWRPGTYTTSNVIAETPDGDPNNVIVVGAHLDSVGVGPGINDNGSGSATILEIAEQVRKVQPRNKIRFIWFGAEEHGLLGSEAYVDSLPQTERDKIAAMLNFDMVGSPNFVRFVYDDDLSDSDPPEGGAPPASADIERLFLDYFASQGLATERRRRSALHGPGPRRRRRPLRPRPRRRRHRLRHLSGAAQESNLPPAGLRRATGFEDRVGHQPRAAPRARIGSWACRRTPSSHSRCSMRSTPTTSMPLRGIWADDVVERFPDKTCRGKDELAGYFRSCSRRCRTSAWIASPPSRTATPCSSAGG